MTGAGQTQPGSVAPGASAPKESLAGLVERVTFFNEENGFAVLKIKARGQRDFVSVVGHLPVVHPGEWIDARGTWTRNREFGLQFQADSIRTAAPSTREGIEKYLGSGMVKGIGPAYAHKLVETFGDKVFDIIENASARLEEVEGIGPKRRKLIKDAWSDQKVVREIMVFLHSHGVGTSRAVRIFKTYGHDAVARVRSDPYGLARHIQGIGFKTADQIAQRLGIPADAPERIEAALGHVLHEATQQGHCALPADALAEAASECVQLPTPRIHSILADLVARGTIVREVIDGLELHFLPALKRAEEEVAVRIKVLVARPPLLPILDLEKVVGWLASRTQRRLAASQAEALRILLSTRACILTGGPGVGKTTLIDAVVRVLQAKKIHVELCAPTGRAARRLSEATRQPARTIHRLLEVQGGRPGFGRNQQNPLETDYLIVDETSMVDVHLMQYLLRALPPRAGLLLVGDADQLPSVGPGSVFADLIQSGAIPVVRLHEIFRQAEGSRIVTNAHRVNQGELPESCERGSDGDFFFIERDTAEATAATLVDLVHNRIPAGFGVDPIRDIQILSPMNRGVVGVRELNTRLQEVLNPKREGSGSILRFGWDFRLGDKVIQTQNNYDKEVFNGDIGLVRTLDADAGVLTVDYDGRGVEYEAGELDELAPAYAITIHKAQGSEFPVVVIPIATQQFMLLQRNLIYTAITRGRNRVILVGQRKALAMAVSNNHRDVRYSGLLWRLGPHGPNPAAVRLD